MKTFSLRLGFLAVFTTALLATGIARGSEVLLFSEYFSNFNNAWGNTSAYALDKDSEDQFTSNDNHTWIGQRVLNARSAVKLGLASTYGYLVSPDISIQGSSASIKLSLDAAAYIDKDSTLKITVIETTGNNVITSGALCRIPDSSTANINDASFHLEFNFFVSGSFKLRFERDTGDGRIVVDTIRVYQIIRHSPVISVTDPVLSTVAGTMASTTVSVADEDGDPTDIFFSTQGDVQITGQTNYVNGVFSYTPSDDDVALSPVVFLVNATDNVDGAAEQKTISVTVGERPSTPVIHEVENGSVRARDLEVFTRNIVIDNDIGENFSASVSAAPAPDGVYSNTLVKVNGTYLFGFKPARTDAGKVFTFTVQASDANGSAEAKQFSVTATETHPPVVSGFAGEYVAYTHSTMTNEFSITDIENDAVSFNLAYDTQNVKGDLNVIQDQGQYKLIYTPARADLQFNDGFSVTLTPCDIDGNGTSQNCTICVKKGPAGVETFTRTWQTGFALAEMDKGDLGTWETFGALTTTPGGNFDTRSIRFGGSNDGRYIELKTPLIYGLSKIRFESQGVTETGKDGTATVTLRVANSESDDTWESVGSVQVTSAFTTNTIVLSEPLTGVFRFRLDVSDFNARYVHIDNIEVYENVTSGITFTPSSLDGFKAYNLNNEPTVSATQTVAVVANALLAAPSLSVQGDYEIAFAPDGTFGSSLNLPSINGDGDCSTNIMIRLVGNTTGAKNENVVAYATTDSGERQYTLSLAGEVKSSLEPVISFVSGQILKTEIETPLEIGFSGLDPDTDEEHLVYNVVCDGYQNEFSEITDKDNKKYVVWTPLTTGEREIALTLSDGVSTITNKRIFTAEARTCRNLSTDVYKEDFDIMGDNENATLPDGWRVFAMNKAFCYGSHITDGREYSSYSSGVFNFGASTNNSGDRALGFLTTSGGSSLLNSKDVIIGLRVKNDTNFSWRKIDVSYSIEKYRTGTRKWTADLYSSTNGIEWAAVKLADDSMPFETTFVADGDVSTPKPLPSEIRIVSGSFKQKVGIGDELYIGWHFNASDSASCQGLGLDDVTIKVHASPATIFCVR